MTRLQTKKKRIRKKEEEEERNVAVSSGERASWNCRLGLHGPRLIGRRRLTPGRPVLMPIRHGLYSRTDRFLPLSPLERRLVSPTSVLHSFAPFHFLREKLAGLLEDIRPIPIRNCDGDACAQARKGRRRKKWEKEKRIYRSLEGREGREGWFEEFRDEIKRFEGRGNGRKGTFEI